ncbi:MAG: CBS domain-containing protein, partial [Balneolales bacterium]
KAHLRIENRLLPSGPTITDEIANAVFWTGLMNGMTKEFSDISSRMKFEDAKINVLKAARYGLGTQFKWVDGQEISAQDLIVNELIPIARQGLKKGGVHSDDINGYLNIIKKRVTTGQTGSQWMFDAWSELDSNENADTKTMMITKAILQRQNQNKPVHEWNMPGSDDTKPTQNVDDKVGNYMSSTLYSVEEDDLVQQVAFRMIKNNYNYVPVADEQGKLKGLITKARILEHKVIEGSQEVDEGIIVKDIMEINPPTADPSTSLSEVIRIMKEHKTKCLPVIHNEKIAGIITEFDIMKVSEYLMEKK